ncbi:MAG: ATP-binding protein [Gemmatimonadales bacterium]|nr:ATP-binding protein [Gemmatimonadales bacterium]
MTAGPAGPADREITLDARRENLAPLLDFLDGALADAALERELAAEIRLAAEEVCVNVVSHAYAGRPPGPVRVRFHRAPGAVHITVEDRGIPFDPATAPVPKLDTDWQARPIGGLGWHLVRHTMDDVHYEPLTGGGNRVTLTRRVPERS